MRNGLVLAMGISNDMGRIDIIRKDACLVIYNDLYELSSS